MTELKIDFTALKVKHIRALEQAKTFDAIAAWFSEHTNITADTLDNLTLPELMELSAQLQSQIKDALTLPKANGGK